jgi:hypothetical protein
LNIESVFTVAPLPLRLDPDAGGPVPARGEPERTGTEPARRPGPSVEAERLAAERRDRHEREMLGRLRVALAEPGGQRPEHIMRRGSYGMIAPTPADLLEQRISVLLGENGIGALRRLDERA